MNTVNVYEKLYSNMKNRFTVINENCEYTLIDAMLIKAEKKSTNNAKSMLPAVKSNISGTNAITTFFRYVNDKLVIKTPPEKDKIIKKFPFRTSFAALCSAIVICAVIISCGSLSLRGTGTTPPTAALTEMENNENAEYFAQK